MKMTPTRSRGFGAAYIDRREVELESQVQFEIVIEL